MTDQPARYPAITVLQPWASLIVQGIKTLETRNWTTPHRGPLYIHASKSTRGLAYAAQHPQIVQHVQTHCHELPLGCLLGLVNLSGITALMPDCDPAPFGWLVDAPWVFHLQPLTMLSPPIPARGHLRLWRT